MCSRTRGAAHRDAALAGPLQQRDVVSRVPHLGHHGPGMAGKGLPKTVGVTPFGPRSTSRRPIRPPRLARLLEIAGVVISEIGSSTELPKLDRGKKLLELANFQDFPRS